MSLHNKTRTFIQDGTKKKSVTLEDYGNDKLVSAEERRLAEEKHIEEQYEIQQDLADDQHRTALRQQAQQRAASKREAYIAHERLQKYLPQVQAAAGTEGMGLSETAKIQGLNAYLGQRSAADAAYTAGVADLEAAKKMSDTERTLARQEAEHATLQDYLDTKEAVEAERSAAVGSIVESKAESYRGTDGKISFEDYQKLADYVDKHRGSMTSDDQALMDLTLEGYREQVRTDAEQMAVNKTELVTKGATFDGISNFKDNKNLVIKAGGAEYRVQLNAPGDAPVTDAAVIAAGGQTSSGDIFGFGNKLYLNHHGDFYAIEARSHSYKEDYDTLYKLFFDGGAGKTNSGGKDQVQTLNAYKKEMPEGSTITTGADGKPWVVTPWGATYPLE